MSRAISVVPLLALVAYGAIFLWALWRGWTKITVVSRMLLGLLALMFLSLANFFVASDLPFDLKGGGPEQGYVRAGHYFVGNHGRFVEVSSEFYHNTLRYERISLLVAMIVLAATVSGFLLRAWWGHYSSPRKNPASA